MVSFITFSGYIFEWVGDFCFLRSSSIWDLVCYFRRSSSENPLSTERSRSLRGTLLPNGILVVFMRLRGERTS